MTKLEIVEKLKQYDLKSTNQRIAIYEAISPMINHPSAELILDVIKTDYPSITLATVYNTLETFAKAGLINKISSANGKLRYDPNIKQHNHIYCENTNDVYDFYDKDLEEIINDFIKSKKIENFEVRDFKLLVKGKKLIENKSVIVK